MFESTHRNYASLSRTGTQITLSLSETNFTTCPNASTCHEMLYTQIFDERRILKSEYRINWREPKEKRRTLTGYVIKMRILKLEKKDCKQCCNFCSISIWQSKGYLSKACHWFTVKSSSLKKQRRITTSF